MVNSRRLCFLALVLSFSAFSAVGAEPGAEADRIWARAVEKRGAGERLAPSTIRYVQYELDRSDEEKSREIGLMRISYGPDGKADMEVAAAEKDGKDFIEERRRRLNASASRRTQMLNDKSPFDPDLQPVLKREPSRRTMSGGIALREYPFELPLEKYTMVGTARVKEEDGSPFDVRYSVRPLPTFVDLIDMTIRFAPYDGDRCIFHEVEYRFAASFLFFRWKGGGNLKFEDWKELSVRPKIGG